MQKIEFLTSLLVGKLEEWTQSHPDIPPFVSIRIYPWRSEEEYKAKYKSMFSQDDAKYIIDNDTKKPIKKECKTVFEHKTIIHKQGKKYPKILKEEQVKITHVEKVLKWDWKVAGNISVGNAEASTQTDVVINTGDEIESCEITFGSEESVEKCEELLPDLLLKGGAKLHELEEQFDLKKEMEHPVLAPPHWYPKSYTSKWYTKAQMKYQYHGLSKLDHMTFRDIADEMTPLYYEYQNVYFKNLAKAMDYQDDALRQISARRMTILPIDISEVKNQQDMMVINLNDAWSFNRNVTLCHKLFQVRKGHGSSGIHNESDETNEVKFDSELEEKKIWMLHKESDSYDIWSGGNVLYELLDNAGINPWVSMRWWNNKTIEDNPQLDLTCYEKMSSGLVNFLFFFSLPILVIFVNPSNLFDFGWNRYINPILLGLTLVITITAAIINYNNVRKQNVMTLESIRKKQRYNKAVLMNIIMKTELLR